VAGVHDLRTPATTYLDSKDVGVFVTAFSIFKAEAKALRDSDEQLKADSIWKSGIGSIKEVI
jgi:hypothetical protein